MNRSKKKVNDEKTSYCRIVITPGGPVLLWDNATIYSIRCIEFEEALKYPYFTYMSSFLYPQGSQYL